MPLLPINSSLAHFVATPNPSFTRTRQPRQPAESPRKTSAKLSPQLLQNSYRELDRLTTSLLSSNRPHPIDPATLINEVARRMLGGGGTETIQRGDYFAFLANALRRLLTDSLVGQPNRLTNEPRLMLIELAGSQPIEVRQLLETLDRLDSQSPLLAQVAVLRLLGGLDFAELGTQIGVPRSGAKATWRACRAWLSRQLA